MEDFELEFGKYHNFIYKQRKPLCKLVQNIGINDSPFVVKPNGCILHPAYDVWSSMLERSYNDNLKTRQVTYKDVTCCDDWLLFTNFARWFKDNYVEGWQLDKDLLVKNNKVYGPRTCVFVPRHINSFLTLRGNHRGYTSIGVKLTPTGKFHSRITDNGTEKYLGSFDTQEEAHQEWQKAKLAQAIAFNFPPLQRVIDQLKFEIENNLETTSL